jgi:hypothetical protein
LRLARALVAASLLVALPACRPDVDGPASVVDEDRVLAVKIEPPEAAPGAPVAARALVAGADGTLATAPLEWAVCRSPKSPAEDRIVNPDCLVEGDPVGEGVDVMFGLPSEGCALFGPETPPGDFRPRDADSTGGYFQPIHVRLGEEDSVALERLLCNLRNAPTDVAGQFLREYVPNRNPTLTGIAALAGDADADLEHVAPRSHLRFVLSWKEGDRETYLRFDPSSQTLVHDEEVLRVSWYATAGSFSSDRTGRGADRSETSSNVWTAPGTASAVHFWAVIRDSRGGQDFTAWDAVVVER